VFVAVGRVGASSELITQKLEYVEDNEKHQRLLYHLPRCTGLTLIFVERKRSAEMLERFLVEEGVNATSIHGDRSQEEREYALAMFRCGRCPVMVATDVAARGLDIPSVMDVINFDMPNNIDDYVHRIGRTGRAGNTGTALTFINDRNRSVLRDLAQILREAKQEIPSWFEAMLDDTYGGRGGFGRGGRGRGGGGGGGGGGYMSRMGDRDFRDVSQFSQASRSRPRDDANGVGNGRNGQHAAGAQPQQQQQQQQQQQRVPSNGWGNSTSGGFGNVPTYGDNTDAW
jgi:ATP-dependent RNA helicase DDX3X